MATPAAMRLRSLSFEPTERLGSITAARPESRVGPFVRVKSLLQSYTYAQVAPLTAAGVFRDCSFRLQSSLPERRACRTLMRQAAIKWRRGVAMGDL